MRVASALRCALLNVISRRPLSFKDRCLRIRLDVELLGDLGVLAFHNDETPDDINEPTETKGQTTACSS